jgi:hypothetical protein
MLRVSYNRDMVQRRVRIVLSKNGALRQKAVVRRSQTVDVEVITILTSVTSLGAYSGMTKRLNSAEGLYGFRQIET